MVNRAKSKAPSSGEALGLKLLQSVREMKAGQAARTTSVEPNEVSQARQSAGLSQAEFAEGLGHLQAHAAGVGAGAKVSFGCRQSFDSHCKASP